MKTFHHPTARREKIPVKWWEATLRRWGWGGAGGWRLRSRWERCASSAPPLAPPPPPPGRRSSQAPPLSPSLGPPCAVLRPHPLSPAPAPPAAPALLLRVPEPGTAGPTGHRVLGDRERRGRQCGRGLCSPSPRSTPGSSSSFLSLLPLPATPPPPFHPARYFLLSPPPIATRSGPPQGKAGATDSDPSTPLTYSRFAVRRSSKDNSAACPGWQVLVSPLCC